MILTRVVGYPYVFHPFYLATQVDDEFATCVALLHDLVEDHGDKYNFDTLLEMEFPIEIVNALRVLTHKKDVPYMEYIETISKNEIAREVKIQDLKHNLDIRRMDGVKSKKYDMYIVALKYLEECK
ncbi:GTP pyrophosphokinase [Erysipelotrichaceae bacterium OH741_COT-311]|nr:GTP pyrophosphokinase [Erysipelotrichaceae bacterium OH741_COT-311]